jgi:hypothetical protein
MLCHVFVFSLILQVVVVLVGVIVDFQKDYILMPWDHIVGKYAPDDVINTGVSLERLLLFINGGTI